jgi:hypothetical protein
MSEPELGHSVCKMDGCENRNLYLRDVCPQHQETPEQEALFRFFVHDADEPAQLLADPRKLAQYLRYDGEYYHLAGETPKDEIPAGYGDKIVCSWDFEPIFVSNFSPHFISSAHCVVCDAPFPLHTIRCGTPG